MFYRPENEIARKEAKAQPDNIAVQQAELSEENCELFPTLLPATSSP